MDPQSKHHFLPVVAPSGKKPNDEFPKEEEAGRKNIVCVLIVGRKGLSI